MSLLRAGDLVVVTAAALLVGAAWATLWQSAGPAEYAEVTAAGGQAQRLPLDRDTTVAVRGRLGESHIELRDGEVRFTDSPCVGRLCVHAGWLSRSGQVAACLPNGVVLEVGGGEREFDAFAF